jgi:tRNA pseudouridine38-40 synthase
LTTLRLTVEYDGTDFSGFQWQPGARTVAGILESVLGQLLGEELKVTAAGRTDAGVHATGQVVSLRTASRFPLERLSVALSALLPADCSIREVAVVAPDFSARFHARERTYVYTILNQTQPSALLARYAWHVARPLDRYAMEAGGAHFVGEHDFRSMATLAPGASGRRTIRRLEIERRQDLLRIEVAANGFLHHMVRSIVGTLVECGLGRRDPAALPELLEARDRTAAGSTAPAHGLCLAGVRYADGYDSLMEPWSLGRRCAARSAATPELDAERAFP